jgi:hypothetical protein
VTAKEIVVKPISSQDAARIVKACHYSGKTAFGSFLHFGVFIGEKCGGVMQFGPPVDKRKILPLVKDTGWNGFLELNRMAFADWLPRNSESRAIAVAMRLIRKAYPHIEWVVSFADGTQCGDGTIYRASGFYLTQIKENRSMWRTSGGEIVADFVSRQLQGENTRKRIGFRMGESWSDFVRRTGAQRLPGFQLRYLYFLNPAARARLTVPILPFSEIDRRGAGMYKGKQRIQSRAGGDTTDTPVFQTGEGGSTPTPALQSSE